jgi:murein DD-endopeptidase MepM/ murein hydrolase activator NlpD
MAVSPFGTNVPLSYLLPAVAGHTWCRTKTNQQAGPSGFDGVRHAKVNAETLLLIDYQPNQPLFHRFSAARTFTAIRIEDGSMKPNRWVLTLLLIATGMLFSFLPKVSSASASDLWMVPVDSPQLVRQFLQPTADWSAGHRGVDYLVTIGQPVFAPHDGEVTFSGTVVNRSIVSIRHSNGILTSLEPLCPSVAAGDEVKTGDQIGTVCFPDAYQSHCGLDTCLHFSMRTNNGYLSPLVKIGGLSPSRLNPWDGLNCSLPSNAQC